MKTSLAVALLGSAIVFALPTVAQQVEATPGEQGREKLEQTNTPDPQLRHQLLAVIEKHNEAMNKNDATAAASCFMPDGLYVTDRGLINGRDAIEKWYADLFRNVHFSNHAITVDPDSPHAMGAAVNQMWATGGWSADIKGKDFGPLQIKGYWSVIREGDDWKIRMLTSNSTPTPAK
jgi:uncharacterized protein (TIGR02246 family)